MASTNMGIAATNAPAKPLRREGIRCMKLSRGRRSNLGNEMTFCCSCSGRCLRPPGLGQRTRPMQFAPTASELQDSQSTTPAARPFESKEFVAKTNDKRQAVRSHLLRQEIEDQRCLHLRNEELQSRRRTCFLDLHWRVYVHIGRINWNTVGSEVQGGFPKWWFNTASRK